MKKIIVVGILTFAFLLIGNQSASAHGPVPVRVCRDQGASNYGYQLPCIYPVQICKDYNASNYAQPLPCVYPLRICQDYNATNYGQSLPCEYYQQRCTDGSANNYGSYGYCTYNQVQCTDSYASNYGSYSSCVYNQTRCTDSSANNYLSYSSCTYNYNQTRCTDTSASNYLAYSSCVYNQTRCTDTSASNYLAYSSCVYNQKRCTDTSASNYLAYNSCIYNVSLNKNVVTTVATNVTKTDAQANGYITNSTFYNSNVYFNYGTTVALGSKTTPKTTSGNGYFSDSLTGLTPDTIYYFQAVGENATGISKGSIEVFKTLGDTVITKTVVVQGTTVVGTESPILLSITNKYQTIKEGDTVDYIVSYKNVGKTKLINPMIQVVIPTNMTLVNSSRGTYAVDTHTLSAPVEDLDAGNDGVIYLQAKVDSIPQNNSQIVTTAILVYTNTKGAQENAMAYAINVPNGDASVAGDSSTLGASAFFGGLLSVGLIGWLLILLAIMVIVLVARSFGGRSQGNSNSVTH